MKKVIDFNYGKNNEEKVITYLNKYTLDMKSLIVSNTKKVIIDFVIMIFLIVNVYVN